MEWKVNSNILDIYIFLKKLNFGAVNKIVLYGLCLDRSMEQVASFIPTILQQWNI